MLPTDRDTLIQRLNKMTVKELRDFADNELNVSLTDGGVDDIEQRVQDVVETAQKPPLKEMTTPEYEDVPAQAAQSDTPNADAALETLMGGAIPIPGLNLDAVIEKLFEILDPLIQPLKPFLDRISELEKEYEEAEGDDAKEKIQNKLEKEKQRLKDQIESLKCKILDMVQNAIDTILNAFRQLKEVLQNIKDMCISCIKIMAMPGAIGPVAPNPMKNAADAKVVAMQMNNMLGMATTPCIQICKAAQEIHFDLPVMVTSVLEMIGTMRQTVQGVITAASALGA